MDHTRRFSNRVDYYVKTRPDYPAAALDFLIDRFGLGEASRIADVGAGTGILSRQLLERELQVYAVEPNKEMRDAAVAALGANPRFQAYDGTAEHTGLTSGTIDLITCGQSFHWFDRQGAAREFRRILKPDGHSVLLWNDPDSGDAFTESFEELGSRYGKDFAKLNHRHFEAKDFSDFFRYGQVGSVTFAHEQKLDREGLFGRLQSSSYMPLPGEAGHAELIEAAEALFVRYAEKGKVAIRYRTLVFYGQL